MLTSTVEHMFRSLDSRRLYRRSSKLTTIFYRPACPHRGGTRAGLLRSQ